MLNPKGFVLLECSTILCLLEEDSSRLEEPLSLEDERCRDSKINKNNVK